jgi:hypothetical protein
MRVPGRLCPGGDHEEASDIGSFHSRLRDEFLEREQFESVSDARAKGSWFRREYNAVRPHSSLGYATPNLRWTKNRGADQRGGSPWKTMTNASNLS